MPSSTRTRHHNAVNRASFGLGGLAPAHRMTATRSRPGRAFYGGGGAAAPPELKHNGGCRMPGHVPVARSSRSCCASTLRTPVRSQGDCRSVCHAPKHHSGERAGLRGKSRASGSRGRSRRGLSWCTGLWWLVKSRDMGVLPTANADGAAAARAGRPRGVSRSVSAQHHD